jgi:hypothetical protein
MRQPPKALSLIIALLILATALTGCFGQDMPQIPDMPITIPTEFPLPNLENLPGYLEDLRLPDLSQIPNLPGLEELPSLQAPENGVVFAGPSERRIEVGQPIPGTNIQLVAISEAGAEFTIDGMRSVRRVGDSLDYDGNWPGIGGVVYNARLRIYTVGDNSVRVAGVHRLVVENVDPVPDSPDLNRSAQFPFTTTVATGESIPGTTYRYIGSDERGAQIGGLPEGDYPYFKTGDSIVWQGHLRGDIPARFVVRVLFTTDNAMQVGGVVTLALP